MNGNIVKGKSQKEKELYEKIDELAFLENELSIKELELITLQTELEAFQSKYFRRVGVRYAELDRIEAEIAELLAKQNPKDEELTEEAKKARKKYKETEKTINTEKIAEEKEIFKPSEKLKNLYREVAKKIHPDYAVDEKDRAMRTRLMQEANLAYKRGDEQRLKEILKDWEMNPDSIKGLGDKMDLERVFRMIKQIKERIQNISKEIVKLKESDISKLKIKVENAVKNKIDLLYEMENRIIEKIEITKNKLQKLKNEKG